MGSSSEHFSDVELRCKGLTCGPDHTGCKVNGCTPELVTALDLFRASALAFWIRCGKDEAEFPGVLVDSAYRCPEHNAQTSNAAQRSQHTLGRAADVRVPGLTPAQLEVIARGITGINGIGRAPAVMAGGSPGYIHVDVRPAPLALWCYTPAGAQAAYFQVPAADIGVSA